MIVVSQQSRAQILGISFRDESGHKTGNTKAVALKESNPMLMICLLALFLPASEFKNCCAVEWWKPAVPVTVHAVADSIPVSAHIYLSFDDGPINASRVIEELVNSDTIKVNMFIIGKYVYKNDTMHTLFDSLRANPAIEIGNHSFTHANRHYRLFYSNTLTAVQDVQHNADTLQLSNGLVRLPGRNMWRINGRTRNDLENGKAVADSLASLGYKIFGWDIEWQTDSCGKMNRTADDIMLAIEHLLQSHQTFTPGHIVVLFHDAMMESPYNYQQFRAFIEKVKANKTYRLEHLSSYPAPQPVAPVIMSLSKRTDHNQKLP